MEMVMRADAPHANRVFWLAPGDAGRVWRAQRALDARSGEPGQNGSEPGGGRVALGLTAWVAEAQAALGGRVYRVPSESLETLQRRIEELDRRAARLGVAPIRLANAGERDPDGHMFVVLQGEAPMLAGWALAAIVEHRDGGARLRAVGDLGERLDPRAFTSARCEHCGLRRRRAATYVVARADTGELRQVGSGCLRDFLGGHDPERTCRQAEYLVLAQDELKHAEPTTTPPRLTLEAFAAHAAHVVRTRGFTSRERAQRDREQAASADLALRSLQCTPDGPDRGDRALAAGALRWANALVTLKPELSQFEADARAVIRSGSVSTRRERGLVCALIAAYRQRRGRSRHLGQPGERLQTVLLVERVTPTPSARYGTVHRCELIDADVNRLAWWQTRGEPLQAGQVVRLAGAVERHTRFGPGAVTVLSHCTPEFSPGGGGLSRRDPVLDM
jgi:hypothetical protein